MIALGAGSDLGTGDRGQGTGDRGQGTGDRGQGTGDRGHGTWDMGQKLDIRDSEPDPNIFPIRENSRLFAVKKSSPIQHLSRRSSAKTNQKLVPAKSSDAEFIIQYSR